MIYIHQKPQWPDFKWDNDALLPALSQVRSLQGKLLGKMELVGFQLRDQAMLKTLTADVVTSSEIEGEMLDSEQVRSSIARKLGMDIAGLVPSDRDVDGVVELMLDATQHYDTALTNERLFGWHAALFPSGRSGMHKITVGSWRKGETGPMQVVSGPLGKERVHFEAPESALVPKEMQQFLQWFNAKNSVEPVLKSGIAHLWFVTIHPFDDGNGRIARAIADMQLSRADETNLRFYSVSKQIEQNRKSYYEILELTQKGSLDITIWLQWYLRILQDALNDTDEMLENVMFKARFWEKHAATSFNKRQYIMLNKILDNFYGKLTTGKWAKIAKCSPDTALRDIQDLMDKGILEKEPGGGRSTSYTIKSSS
ncbi:Fic family protein [Saccharicrinis sp. FJH54]|uniref:Fic family protein n=1 Tax=Saccharicrinis sp. FJH54 TaxID=3344665 RepID=UPI0035D518E5